MVRNRKAAAILAGALSLSLLAAACGDEGGNTTDPGSETTGGQIFVSGSSTVEPITALNAELFAEENPDVAISVEGPGTSDGFELFCNGETDIQDASRAIDEEEIANCEKQGIEYTELYVAIDGMAVITSPENSTVECLNLGDLYALIGPESEGFENWSDADTLGKKVKGIGIPYPDAPLDITGPGEESGTFDSFIDLALVPIGEDVLGMEDVSTRPDYVSSGNDNVIVEGIIGSSSSLGWVGYAFYQQNADSLKAIEIADGQTSDCVAPSPETIADGSYPLSRPLYIYVNNGRAAENPAVPAFVDFYMGETGLGEAVSSVGYIEVPDEEKEATRSTWDSAGI